MTIAEQIAELEEGFRHLVESTLAIARTLQEENALLLARLDERRAMPLSLPLPVKEAEPVKLKRWQILIDKHCKDCNAPMRCTKNRHYCKLCFREHARATRLRSMQARAAKV